LSGNIPALDVAYKESRLRADENLSKSGVDSLFSKGLDKIMSNLMTLTPDTVIPAIDTTGWTPMTDANGNRALVGPNGEVKEL
jgi:hypothetical protein